MLKYSKMILAAGLYFMLLVGLFGYFGSHPANAQTATPSDTPTPAITATNTATPTPSPTMGPTPTPWVYSLESFASDSSNGVGILAPIVGVVVGLSVAVFMGVLFLKMVKGSL